MLTKAQKQQIIENIKQAAKHSGGLLFVDFSKVKTSELNGLRRKMKEREAELKVFKKRLLKIAFEKTYADIDPSRFPAQAGVVFARKDILSIAGLVYQFGKAMVAGGKIFKVLGGYDIKNKKPVTEEEFMVLAKLPSREILIAQLAIVLTMPVRKLAYALNGRKKQI